MAAGEEAAHRNGIQIADAPEFRGRLLAYLTSPDPLPSCRNCLGSAGRYIEHQQIRRDGFRAAQCHPTEELIHPRLVGPARLALAKAESLVPRTVVDSTERAMASSAPLIGLLREVQGLNSTRFRG